MRLIDADALWTNIANNSACYHDCCRAQGEKGVLELIDEAPTIEAEPVKCGHWVYGELDIPHCSECGTKPKEISPYCSGCGAKMDGEG